MSKFAALALSVNKPERMTLLHPVTRQPLRLPDGSEAFIELYSRDSKIAREKLRAIVQRRIDRRDAGVSAAENETNETEILAALSVSWSLVGREGEPIDVPFSEANACELYTDPDTSWVREDVEKFVHARGNFAQPSSKT